MMKYIEISKNAILSFSGLKVPFWSGFGWFGIEITKSTHISMKNNVFGGYGVQFCKNIVKSDDM